MTRKAVWQARIKAGTATLGAGILVAPAHVLTCAHLVGAETEFKVGFPLAPRLDAVTARVSYRGPWRRLDDDGDVAVLELARPVDIEAPELAAPGERSEGELLVCGFGRGAERGAYARLRADFSEDLDEWVQVELVHGHLQELRRGFSGGGVFDRVSGKVFGMVTDGGGQAGIGRMVTVDGIRRYWEELDELLPLGWLDAGDRRFLREAVRGVTAGTGLEHIYEELFPGRRLYRPFRSVWDSIRYVAEEDFDEHRLRHYLDALTPHLPAEPAAAMRAWSRRRLPAPPPRPAPQAASAIVVRIERRARSYGLEMFTLLDGRAGPRVPPQRLGTPERVKERVQRQLPEMIAAVGHRVPVIEFMLPESWLLDHPVEEWRIGNGPLKDFYPVVVRDVDRVQRARWSTGEAEKVVRYGQAMHRWKQIDGAGALRLEGIGCRHPYGGDRFSAWLTVHTDLGALAYGFPPRAQLSTALNHGVPVMLWPRATCSHDEGDECSGDRFLADLLAAVESVPAGQLPERVKFLRAEAMLHEDRPHCGRALTLFWDDPRRVVPPLSTEA